MARYRIFAELAENVTVGCIYIASPTLQPHTIARVRCQDTGKTIWCETMPLDANFLTRYNLPPRLSIKEPESAMVVGHWYRTRLGDISTQSEVEMTVEKKDALFGRFKASQMHPSNVVRMAWVLAVVSCGLGLLGLILGVFGLLR